MRHSLGGAFQRPLFIENCNNFVSAPTRNGKNVYITWADYVGMATRSYYESFTPLNLINGFRSTGLWPINAAEPLEAMKNVEPSEKKKKSQREIRSMKRKLDLALFELPSELKEKKQRLGPVARVKVFGGCLTSNEVESALPLFL